MASEHSSLGASGTFRFHDVGINYPRAALGHALLYTGPQQDPGDIPVTRGRDFGPLTPVGHSAFLHHDWRERIPPRSGVAVREEVYRLAPKLLLRQTADRPIATLDQRGVYFGRSVIALTAAREWHLLWLAAVLNSRTFATLYRALAPELGRTFAQVKVSTLRLIPLPSMHETSPLPSLARTLLDLQTSPLPPLARTLPDTEHDPDRRALWSAIDREVARIYALTRAEIRRTATR